MLGNRWRIEAVIVRSSAGGCVGRAVTVPFPVLAYASCMLKKMYRGIAEKHLHHRSALRPAAAGQRPAR